MKPVPTILAILGAAAAGVVAGMLIAPKKGSETREDVRRYLKAHCPGLKKEKLQEVLAAVEVDD